MSQRGTEQLKAGQTAGPPAFPEADPAKPGLGAALKANRKRLLMGVAALAVAGLGWWGFNYATTGRYLVSTDDAYVRADATTLAAKVSGYVARVLVDDNSYVRAGAVIARIDDGDYRLAVDAARDKVATQQATVARIGRQVGAPEQVAQRAEVPVEARVDGDPAVPGLEHLRGHGARMPRADRARHLARVDAVGADVVQQVELRVEQAGLDAGALARARAPLQRREHADRREQARGQIGRGDAGAHRLAAREALASES